MQDVVAALFQWAYGVWPSYGPAIVLASLVISAFLIPFAVLEVRMQWKVFARFGARAWSDDPSSRLLAYRELYRGRRLLLFLARRALLLGSAILVLVTVMRWHQHRSQTTFAGIDLGSSVFTVVMINPQDWPVVTHSVIPAVFVLVYAVAGAKPLAGSRTVHLLGAALIALLVPGAVVLYLLTVLLATKGVVGLMTRAATFARENRHDRVRATGWADYSLPADRWQPGILALWGGWLGCLLGTAATVAAELYALTTLPGDPRDLSLGFDTEPLFIGSLVGAAGLLVFAKGENLRWMGQIMLSRISAYRDEHGFPQRTESLAALNRSMPRPTRRAGIGLMAIGGMGACGLGCTGVMIGLRYTWELLAGGGAPLSVSVLPLILGIALLALGNGLLRAGGRRVQHIISSPKDLVAGSYALYLRSFDEDPKLARLHRIPRPTSLVRGFFTAGNPEEERLADALAWAGLPVSVGRPGERAPHVGVPRVYLPFDGWQEPVREMMRGASLVVLVLGRGAGTLWELGEAMRTLPPERLLLLVTMPRQEYDRCREVVEAELREQVEAVRRETGTHWTPPSLPDYAGSPVVATRIRGLIYFTPAWKAVFAPLERPPRLENQLLGALDRSMWPVAVQLTGYEQRTGKRHS
ncbi:hypothetical protein AB0I53_19635 [Saccharopolyspora sp. NPDC050389]|uniref:hypothetical protein n=1 Tax=Saccharopolyspora sp. NPDC050389 TaxID=3155516 RepID=UPI0033C079A9